MSAFRIEARGRRKLLYLMHVDWRWIKQRPQFLAESLAAEYDIRVFHRIFSVSGSQLTDVPSAVSPFPLLPIPWSWRLCRFITKPLQRRWISWLIRDFTPEVIWITHPALIEMIPSGLMGVPIVYDCMDDTLGFGGSRSRLALLAHLERQAVARAARIFGSSNYLCEVLKSRYGASLAPKIELVRNGISEALLQAQPARSQSARVGTAKPCKVAYFGTIAEWFDFDALMKVLRGTSHVEFHLVGPVSVRFLPQHERLKIHRPVRHDQLAGLAEGMDAFVMPFRRSPVVEAVDPVKLYEYLAFGKEVICVRYKEIQRFAEFVHLYDNADDLLELLNALAAGRLPSRNEAYRRDVFLTSNTWRSRYSQIHSLIQSLPA